MVTTKKKTKILETANSVDALDPSAYVYSTGSSNGVGGVDSRCRDWNRYASTKSAFRAALCAYKQLRNELSLLIWND